MCSLMDALSFRGGEAKKFRRNVYANFLPSVFRGVEKCNGVESCKFSRLLLIAYCFIANFVESVIIK